MMRSYCKLKNTRLELNPENEIIASDSWKNQIQKTSVRLRFNKVNTKRLATKVQVDSDEDENDDLQVGIFRKDGKPMDDKMYHETYDQLFIMIDEALRQGIPSRNLEFLKTKRAPEGFLIVKALTPQARNWLLKCNFGEHIQAKTLTNKTLVAIVVPEYPVDPMFYIQGQNKHKPALRINEWNLLRTESVSDGVKLIVSVPPTIADKFPVFLNYQAMQIQAKTIDLSCKNYSDAVCRICKKPFQTCSQKTLCPQPVIPSDKKPIYKYQKKRIEVPPDLIPHKKTFDVGESSTDPDQSSTIPEQMRDIPDMQNSSAEPKQQTKFSDVSPDRISQSSEMKPTTDQKQETEASDIEKHSTSPDEISQTSEITLKTDPKQEIESSDAKKSSKSPDKESESTNIKQDSLNPKQEEEASAKNKLQTSNVTDSKKDSEQTAKGQYQISESQQILITPTPIQHRSSIRQSTIDQEIMLQNSGIKRVSTTPRPASRPSYTQRSSMALTEISQTSKAVKYGFKPYESNVDVTSGGMKQTLQTTAKEERRASGMKLTRESKDVIQSSKTPERWQLITEEPETATGTEEPETTDITESSVNPEQATDATESSVGPGPVQEMNDVTDSSIGQQPVREMNDVTDSSIGQQPVQEMNDVKDSSIGQQPVQVFNDVTESSAGLQTKPDHEMNLEEKPMTAEPVQDKTYVTESSKSLDKMPQTSEVLQSSMGPARKSDISTSSRGPQIDETCTCYTDSFWGDVALDQVKRWWSDLNASLSEEPEPQQQSKQRCKCKSFDVTRKNDSSKRPE